jgi:hypothetical protein
VQREENIVFYSELYYILLRKLAKKMNGINNTFSSYVSTLQLYAINCTQLFFRTFLTILKYRVKVLNVIYKHNYVREMMKGQNSDEVCWTFTSVFLADILTHGRRQLFVKVSSEILTGMNRIS